MKIACLGWGSLVWDPQELPIQRQWFNDGPVLPIEFTRISDDKRVTLIIDTETNIQVRTLWALMLTNNLERARESLKIREGTPKIDKIHSVNIDYNGDEFPESKIAEWLKSQQIDTAIWTGLSYNKKYFKGKRPSIKQILNHLAKLKKEEKFQAAYYIRKAPRQIDTAYRRRIEAEFGWIPID